MRLFANYDSDRSVTSIVVAGLSDNQTSSMILVTNPIANNLINISGTLVDFTKFLKNLKSFKVNESGNILFKDGQSVATFDDSIIELDESIPMAYTRANTVVNFGSL